MGFGRLSGSGLEGGVQREGGTGIGRRGRGGSRGGGGAGGEDGATMAFRTKENVRFSMPDSMPEPAVELFLRTMPLLPNGV